MFRPVAFVKLAIVTLSAALIGCSTPAPQAAALLVPGHYPPSAEPTPRLKVALPDVAVGYAQGAAPDVDLMAVASDELLSLLQSSNRFDLTERQRLRQVLTEQNSLDMIQPGRLAKPGVIRGIDMVLLGQINDLSIKKQEGPDTLSVTGLMQKTHIEKVIPHLAIDANVSLALVDVKTGAADVARSDRFHLIATPQELGLKLTSDQLNEVSEVRLSPEDTHTVLRYILDQPLRPMLPRIDRFALEMPSQKPIASKGDVVMQSPGKSQPDTRPSTDKKVLLLICPDCGFKLTGDEEFCPNCHRKLK
jgi:curli biogenesis system outer membrane secretion channel CsgG